MIRIKRVYDAAAAGDGKRILVDRLWPRGLTKDKASVDEWMKEIAPSDGLRKWFGHDPSRWPEFKKRYEKELEAKSELLGELKGYARHGTVTLVYAAKDTDHNNAVVLKELIGAER